MAAYARSALNVAATGRNPDKTSCCVRRVRLTEEEALSLALSTIAKELSGENTTVRSRLGLSTIMPALPTVPARETTNGLSRSLVASTMFRAGKPPPLGFRLTGFETNARKVKPLVVVAAFEPPHEIRPVLSTMETKRELKVLFNPGTPRALMDRELDARRADYSRGCRNNFSPRGDL